MTILFKIFVFLTALSLGSISCTKEKPVLPAACTETVPAGEPCEAFFTRCFFDQTAHKCLQKHYSGCSLKGFGREQECEVCICNQ